MYVDSRKEIIDSGATQRKIESETYDTIVKRYIMGDKKHSIAHDTGVATNTVCTYVAYYDFFMSSGEVLSEAFSKDQEEFRKLYIEGYSYEEMAEKFKMGLSSTKLKVARLKKLGIIDNNDVVARSKALMEISASPVSSIVKVDTLPVKDIAVETVISSRITDGKDQIIHLYLNNNDPMAIHRLTKVNMHIINNVIKAFEESKNVLFSSQKDGLSRTDYKAAIRLYTNGDTVDSISNKLGFSLDIVRAYVHFYEKGTMDSNTKDETTIIEEKVEKTHQPELVESLTEKTEKESMNDKVNIPVTESRLIIDLGEGQRIEVNGDVTEFASILNKLRSGDASLQDITNIGKYLNDTDISVYEMEEVSC